MIKKTKLIPIICGICATTATVVPAVSCTCSFVTEKLQLSGGNIRLETSINTAGSDAKENKWVLKYNEEEIPYDKWESAEIKSLGSSDVSKIHFDTEKHIVKWDAIEEAKAYAFVIAVKTVDGLTCESTPIVLDVNEDKPVVATITGGTPLIQRKVGDATKSYDQYGMMVDGAIVMGATFELEDEPQFVTIDQKQPDRINVDTLIAKGSYTFTIKGTATKEKKVVTASANVSIVVSDADVYEVTGGSVSLTAQAGVPDADDGKWKLIKNGQAIDDASLTLDGAPDGVSISKEGIISWTDELVSAAGDYQFNIIAKSGTVEQKSPDIFLKVNPADVYGVSGGTNLLSISTGTTGKDANIWVATKNGHEISDVNYELSDNAPECFDLDNPENAKNGKQLSWTTATDFDGTIQILITRGEGTKKETLASADIKIVVKPNISAIEIVGDDVIYATTGSHYAIKTYPESTSIGATWEVTSWVPDVADLPTPELDPRETDCIINAGNVSGTLTIQATSTVDTSLVATKQIRVEYPWKDSDQIWGYCTHEGLTGWYEFDEDSLYATDSDISCTPLGGGAETTIARDEFVEYDIYIGDKVTRIKDNFLNGCTSFNSAITFGNDNECFVVGDNFMSECKGFNQTLTLPNTIYSIGSNFMYGCTAFANNRLTDDAGTFALPTSLTTIGDAFLYECKAFNSNITIGTDIQYIGNTFMFGCEAMSSGTAPGVVTFANGFDYRKIASSASLSISFAVTYTEGTTHSIIIDCSGDSALQAGLQGKFPNLGSTTGFYRSITYR